MRIIRGRSKHRQVARAVTIRTDSKKPGRGWWLLAALMLMGAIALQIPAAWLAARFFPNNPYVDQVSGQLWSGQVIGHGQGLSGVLSWRLRPQDLFWLRLGADVQVESGSTRLQGQVALGRQQLLLRDWSGQVDAETLRSALPWQWPASPVQVRALALHWHQQKGWQAAQGTLNWGGGALGYPFEGRLERAVLPPLQGKLSLDKERLHLALLDNSSARMGDVYVDREKMLDVQLTQRLLLNVAGYQGQAGLDTAVVSVRQPLSSLGQ